MLEQNAGTPPGTVADQAMPIGKAEGLTRDPAGEDAYSASGIYGDATLATREKGEIVLQTIVDGMLREIQELRNY